MAKVKTCTTAAFAPKGQSVPAMAVPPKPPKPTGPIAAWFLDGPASVWHLTTQAKALLGFQQGAETVSLDDFLSRVADADRESVAASFEALRRDGCPFELRCRMRLPSGCSAAAGLRCVQICGESSSTSRPAHAVGTVQDITDDIDATSPAPRPAHEEAAMHDPAIWRAMPDLWFVFDAQDRFDQVSRPDHESLARPWSDVSGRHFAQVMPATVSGLVASALRRARAQGSVERVEYQLRTAAGALRSFEARLVVLPEGRWLCLTRDVTAASAAQHDLRESEARYARAVRGTSDGLWDWEVASGRDYLSPRWKELLGFAPHELASAADSFFGRIHPEDAPAVHAAVNAHFQHGAPFDIEIRLKTKDDTYRWFRSRGEAERHPDGRPLRMAGSIADITVRKQIEEALRDSETKFSAIFQTAPVGISLTSLEDGRVIEVNEEMARILGWPVGEMVGRTALELGVWLDTAQRAALSTQVHTHGRAALQRLALRHRSGHIVHAKLSAQRLALGGRAMMLTAVTDITDRHVAEQALSEQREAYEAIFNAASDAIVTVDDQGRVLIFNPGAERIFQRAAASLHGQSIQSLLLPRVDEDADDWFQSPASQTWPLVTGARRVKGRRADGHPLELEASFSHATVAGRPVSTAILRDVTERVRADAEGLRLQSELFALTRQLMAQERLTTRRLAQAMHDQLGQTLTALRITLDRDRRAAAELSSEALRRREQLGELVDQAIRQVRSVLVELRPPLLDEEGLYAALDNEVAARAALHVNTDVMLDVAEAVQTQRWPQEVEYAFFMIAREALDNALRHAGARMVTLRLFGDDRHARLEVADDGVGLAPEAHRARPGHLGLIGMRERAHAIGGVLHVEAGSDSGTRCSLVWSAST